MIRRRDQGAKYDGRSISENMRDLDAGMRRGLRWSPRVIDSAYYTEPLWLGGLAQPPLGITLIRLQALNGPEAAVAGVSGLVHFVMENDGRARITKIAGLTASTDTQYRFTFAVAFAGGL